MVNTDPRCFWLTNFLETLPCVSLVSHDRGDAQWYEESNSGLPRKDRGSQLHDFGFRGVSSVEAYTRKPSEDLNK